MAAVKLRFLVDVSVGVDVTSFLREREHDVVSVREIDPRASDAHILSTAVTENRIVITMDKDFGELVHRSVEHIDKLENHFCVYQNGRLRIR